MTATVITTSTSTEAVGGPGRRWTRLARPLTVVAAAASALVGWVIAGPLLGIDLAVRAGPASDIAQVGPVAVAVVAGLIGLAGWALLAVLERLTTRARTARTAWTTTALVLLVASLAGPLTATNAAATAALAALHLAVAAVLIAGLRHTAIRRPVDGGH